MGEEEKGGATGQADYEVGEGAGDADGGERVGIKLNFFTK